MASKSRSENPALKSARAVDVTPAPDVTGGAAAEPDKGQWRYNAVRVLLEKVPQEFEFFQLVRLLERTQTDRFAVGRFKPPTMEVAHFAANAQLAFPASRVHNLFWREGKPPVVVINFMGLTGPMGVLPLFYTELVMERIRNRDTSIASFFDMFNHRMVSLFYQAWEKYRFTVAYERGERDRFSHILLDVIGLGTKGLQNRQAILDDSMLFYSGLLALHTRPAAALEQILSDYFDVPVKVEQLEGAWHPLERSNQCQFDKAMTHSEQLGVGAIVGDEIWDQQSSARVKIGPLPLAQYLDFLPTGSAYAPLKAWLSFYSGWEIDYEVQLILQREEVPSCELGAEGDGSPKLGWVSWNKNVPMRRDPDETILRM